MTAALIEKDLFVEFYAGSWQSLLTYFQERTQLRYLPLAKGKPKHVDNAAHILRNEFAFNAEFYGLGENFDWLQNPSCDLEWLILLHKFYYLKDLAGAYDYTGDEIYAQKWLSLLESWIAQVPVDFIDSQVTGRRLQQWLLSFHTFVTEKRSKSISPAFLARFMHSVYAQTQYLCNHLTPEGNHRTLELYAIFLVAVTFPELRLASKFLQFSIEKLLENMHQDLLPDGVHRELSTDYHHTVLKNYLHFRQLAKLNDIELPSSGDTLLQNAIKFSYIVHKPDGFIPAINDGDCNRYVSLLNKAFTDYPDPHLQFVLTQGEQGLPPEQRSHGFKESGYYVLRSDWNAKPYTDARYLLFDCGPLGFGSHGHYDALNIEVAAFGRSLIVDPGRYTYSEQSPDGLNWRHYFKGTAAHNTVVVDGLDQMPYRCERPVDEEPRVFMHQFVTTATVDYLHGQVISHEYPVIHERMIFCPLGEYWIISDQLKAETGLHDYDLYFHLASDAQGLTQLVSIDCCHLINSPNLSMLQPHSANTEVKLESGYVSPEYGKKLASPVIKFTRKQIGNTTFHTLLFPFKDQSPVINATLLPVYQAGRLCSDEQASAIQINLHTADGHDVEDIYFVNHAASKNEFTFADLKCVNRVMYLRRNAAGQTLFQHWHD